MRVVFIDTAVDGHHVTYLNHLVKAVGSDAIAILPERVNELNCHQYIYRPINMYEKNLRDFINWNREIYNKVKDFNPDVIHILTADSYLKYFGLGIRKLRKICPVVLTLHWCRQGQLQRLSRRKMAKACDRIVVHSDYILDSMKSEGIYNGSCIEYPQFAKKSFTADYSKKKLGLDTRSIVIAAIGNTRQDKGLDILLKALKDVKQPFQLLIAGKPEYFDKDYIASETISYRNMVHTMLRYLTDDEFKYVIAASDIIALPYRHIFNGASGPLVEGAYLGKIIIGSDHGNLGDTIRRNHLGYCFETENVADLGAKIREAISTPFVIDEKYREFQEKLSPEKFCSSYMQLYQICANGRR